MGKAPTRDVEPGRLLHLASPLMTGPDVKALQKLLNATGYGKGIDEDGEYGPMTAQAVTARATCSRAASISVMSMMRR